MKFIAHGALAACLLILGPESSWASVGRTQASFGTTPSGVARYSVPIFAPRGAGNLTPKIALTYSSNERDGLAGAGMSLDGLSTIDRCSKTIDQDGAAASPKLTTADRFCLDGVQLRLASGTSGVAGSTYRTELETFTRITAVGVAGNGPASFVAEQKDGLIYEYGNTGDSRIESLAVGGGQVATARAWALSKIRDRAGNAIEFTYVEDLTYGAFRPNEIRWTSNPGQGLAAAYRMVFVYEATPRPDTLHGYRFGNRSTINGQITETRRIDRIDVLYTSNLVRRYELTYDGGGAGARSRLQSIQECTGSGDCLGPTTFSWINGTAGWNAEVSTGQAMPVQPMVVDINNDGRDDLVYSSAATAGAGYWYYMLAGASGYIAPASTGQTNYGYMQAMPLDWDGDGREDFIAPNASNQWAVFHANGNGFDAPVSTGISAETSSGSQWWTADVDGDGRGDLVRAQNALNIGVEIYARLSTGSGFTAESLLTQIYNGAGNIVLRPNAFGGHGTRARSSARKPDFNGDGREDFVLLVSTYLEPDPPNPTVIINSLCEVIIGNAGASCIDVAKGATALPQTWLMGDATGDGLTDLFYIYNNTAYVAQSRGDWPAPANFTAFADYAAAEARTADWDGDGRDDLIAPSTSSGVLFVARSTGAALTSPVSTGLSSGTGNFAAVGDINGDALPDLLRQNGIAWVFSLHQGVRADMLDQVTDGYANVVNFDYVSIAQSQYTRLTGASYPEQDYQNPRYVVSQYAASNGVGGAYTVAYWYYGARYHTRGRGFLGFSERRTLDSRNGLYSYEYFQQAFPFTGLPARTDLYQSNNATLISRVESTWIAQLYGSGFDARRLPHLATTVHTKYEAGGAYNGALLGTESTTNVLDAATGTTSDSTTVTTEAASANGVNAGQSHTQRVWHSAFFTDAGSWCIGKPATTQVTQSHSMATGAAATRTTDVAWDGVNCRPTQIVSQRGDAKWQVTTDVGYDGFGNISSQTVTGIGMPSRTTLTDWGSTGQFPTAIRNPLSQQSAMGWDQALGVQTSETDANGLAISWSYDGFGRRSHEKHADGTATSWAYSDCAGVGCVNSNNKLVVVSTEIDVSGNAVRDAYTYLDRFDRPLVTREQTLSGAYNRTEREYDAQGHLLRESAPCWWGGCTSATAYWTRYGYDAIDRLVQISRPVNDGSGVYECGPIDASPSCQHSYVRYEGLTARVIDAEGKSSVRISNALGGVSRTTDAAGLSVSFDYDAFANVTRVSDNAAGSTTLQSYTYNINGARLTSTDADLGNWAYTPNALGELISQRDANGAVTTFTYDSLGRLTSRSFPNGGGTVTSTYSWGASAGARNIGRLAWQEIGGTGVTTYREVYSYDAIGRLVQTQYIAGATSYNVQLAYAAATGLLESLTYPVSTEGYRFKLRYGYRHGQLYQVSQFDSGTRYWLANAQDARGHVIDETLGDPADMSAPLRTTSGYDPVTGFLESRQTGPGGGSSAQNLAYAWNKVGSLTLRQDNNQGLTERFYYDDAHRLDYSTLNGTTNLDLSYNSRGNVSFKSGVGAYTYSPTRVHAVTSVSSGTGTLAYAYDANGNMTKRAGSTLAWFADNLLKAVDVNSTNPSSFLYTPYGRRWQQSYRVNGSTEYTVYIGSIFERVIAGGVTTYKHYIHANGRPVGFYVRNTSGTKVRYTLLQDHLGSVDAFYNTNGTLRVRESFDAFGKRRGANWKGTPSASDATAIASLTRRGFTNHEHLDATGLIHMNGRVFDPSLARFLSADPYVPDPDLPQAYNRYSYVENNPLSFVDPDGFQPTCAVNNAKCTKADEPPGTGDRLPHDWRNGARISDSGVKCYGNCGTSGYFNSPFVTTARGTGYWIDYRSRISAGPVDADGMPVISVSSRPSELYVEPFFRWSAVEPFRTIGQDFGALAAYAHGLFAGNKTLQRLALDGLRENQAANAATLAGLMLTGRTGTGRMGSDGVLPDSALVCRGGSCTAERFTQGAGVSIDSLGKLQGVSVNSALGKTVQQLTIGMPHRQVGVTTVGAIRSSGGEVIQSGSAQNPFHCTLCGVTPQRAQELFTPTVSNPNR